MSKSKNLFERAKAVMPSGVNSPVRYFEPYPFFVRRSDQCYMWDADGRQITDFCNGYGALLLGHRRKEIMRAVAAQMDCGTLYCVPTEQETMLSEMIMGNYPSVEMVRLVNTGGEATMTAIRLARGYTKKNKIIKFEGCYHGAHDSVLVKAGSGAAHNGISVSEGGLDEVSRNTLVAQYNNYADLEAIINGDDDIAAVIIEPIIANMGLILPEKNFLEQVKKITRQNGIVLIFDEVVTGFRVSPGGAQEYFGVRPDITTMAKALGNGFAIAAVGGRQDIMENLAPSGRVYQASTFAGNPIAVSAAIASIKTINQLKGRMYSKLEKNCEMISRAIGDIATDYGIPHQINSISSMMQIFFSEKPVTDYATAVSADAEKFKQLFAALLKDGVFVAPSQFEVVFLSNAHAGRDLNHAIEAYRSGLDAVRH